ncbi:hypothetical protein AAFF_G00319060 [Aldrovandia affinis]|uniref:Uncharacterized protein n=1 Tax=Aldrovandia affinis TaxID=143900 RepID=A0AAD7WQM7_9TELE|nr:hypothetical protein AAFF_G00319060 [Aldrovandia affinis]
MRRRGQLYKVQTRRHVSTRTMFYELWRYFFLCVSVRRKSPVRFLREAPKIYEMCLHVLLREQGCRGGIARIERLEPTRSPQRNRHGDGPLGQWVPSPPLGSALLSVPLRKDADEGGALERSQGLRGLSIG